MAKKTFAGNLSAALKSSPAQAFISAPPAQQAQAVEPVGVPSVGTVEVQAPKEQAPVPTAAREDGRELKSRRTQFLLKPSNVEWLKATAQADGGSMNDLVNRLIEQERERRTRA